MDTQYVNTWPNGIRKALSQDEHEKWNSYNYPDTKQLCCDCESPTGRCEDDSIFIDDLGPLCEECFNSLAP